MNPNDFILPSEHVSDEASSSLISRSYPTVQEKENKDYSDERILGEHISQGTCYGQVFQVTYP